MHLLHQPTGLHNESAVRYTGALAADPLVRATRPRPGSIYTVRPPVRGAKDSVDTHHIINGHEYVWITGDNRTFLVPREELEQA